LVANPIHCPRPSVLAPQDPAVQPHLDARGGAFRFEQLENLLRAVVAEELPVFPLVPGNAVSLDQPEEIPRRVAREGGLWEVGAAAGDVVRGRGAEVGEIAASAAGDENLVAEACLVFEHEHAPTAPASHLGTEKPGGTAANDNDIVVQPTRRFRKSRGNASREWMGPKSVPHEKWTRPNTIPSSLPGVQAVSQLVLRGSAALAYPHPAANKAREQEPLA
jgi:hypothetical protein